MPESIFRPRPPPARMALTEQEQIRRDHLDALRDAGVEPFPADAWPVTHRAADVLAAFDDVRHQPGDDGEPAPEPFRATVAGRMMTKRVMGKAAFFHLADESGAVQIYVTRDDLADGVYNTVFKKLLDTGDWLGVEGEVFRTRMGEVSVPRRAAGAPRQVAAAAAGREGGRRPSDRRDAPVQRGLRPRVQVPPALRRPRAPPRGPRRVQDAPPDRPDDPAVPGRPGLRRGRDAGAPAALRRRRGPALHDAPQTRSTCRSFCASRTSSISSGCS